MAIDWIARMERLIIETCLPRPDAVITDDAQWFRTLTPSSNAMTHNAILRCRLPDEGADQHIDTALAPYLARGCQIRWVITPSSAPADLGERLVRRGFGPPSETRCMVAPTRLRSTVEAANDAPRITPVDRSNLDAYIRTFGRAVGDIRREALEDVRQDALRHLEVEPGRVRMYLATVDGKAAGAASSRFVDRIGLLSGAAVIPSLRRRGAYRALLAARLRDMRASGVEHAVTLARAETSAPICARHGFREVCRCQLYLRSAG